MRYCNKCGGKVTFSDNPNYAYQCEKCDEDLFAFETHEDYSVRTVIENNIEDYLTYHSMVFEDLTREDLYSILGFVSEDLNEYASDILFEIAGKEEEQNG